MDPPPPDTSQQSILSPMEVPIPTDPSASSALWDWSDLLDFSLDDQLNISLDSDHSPPEPEPEPDPDPDLTQILPNPEVPGKVRKRDPRLTCSNFMAGRIPCACPELDAKVDEEGLPGKKRARTARAPAGTARCQVPGCEADISELKGYHKRHRVCLRCANASAVVLDGQRKRYCQQCGKFHILSDFDEGKRSCRRKLERHNNRRRRKSSESRVTDERESQGLALVDDVVCDDENEKDSTSLSSQPTEREPLLESEEGQISTHCSNLVSQNISFMASGEAQIDGEKDESKYARSSVYPDNKSAYSSVCPTGRISFKLYDWNPAEFPRRLRHQIFQWLASMPVELEGYIRPGCTILTVFIAMPNFMWSKLLQDPIAYIWDFVAVPGKMLAGRGTAIVYLDNLIFRVVKDVNSVMQVKVEEQAPKLHYVHPTCFEAGKPMEFVACGSNLLQPKFRFLVSFAGKYLTYDYSIPSISSDSEGVTAGFDRQLLKIYIPHTEPDLFGPAFVEVENEFGLSNFIPILIGDKGICSEMKVMENRFEASLSLKGSKSTANSSLSDSCEVSIVRQKAFSQFILDTAWLLRKPALEDIKYTMTPSQIRRFNGFMAFLMHNNSVSILERVIHYIEIVMDNMKLNCVANGVPDAELKLLRSNLDNAKGILNERLQDNAGLVQLSRSLVPKGGCLYQSSQIDMASVVSLIDQDMEMTQRGNAQDHSSTIPFLNQEVVMSVKLMEMPRKSCSRLFTNKYLTSRPFVFVIAATAVCFAICVVVLHPPQVGKIATTIRRCMVDNP